MASTLQTIIKLTLNPILSTDIGSLQLTGSQNLSWPNGTAASQSDLVYAARRTVASSGSPDTIDLSGSLVMADGSAAVFARVTAIYIAHLGTAVTDDANILSVGGGSNPFATWLGGTTPVVKIRNRGFILLGSIDSTSYAVTAGTGDILQVATAAGTSVPYAVIIVGRSA